MLGKRRRRGYIFQRLVNLVGHITAKDGGEVGGRRGEGGGGEGGGEAERRRKVFSLR